MSTEESSGGRPEPTVERRLAGWQRALRWLLWLAFLAMAVANSQSVRFSAPEWLLLVAAVLTVGGVAGTGAAVYDVATGRAGVGDVLHDAAIFVAGWVAELVAGIGYDAELENTHGYALFLLLLPGLILLWLNLVPLLKRGSEFRVEAAGSVLTRVGDGWEPLLDYQYSAVAADGRAIRFTPPTEGPPPVRLPQARVFCRENGARLKSELSAEFFRELLMRRGFHIEAATSSGSHFTARRT